MPGWKIITFTDHITSTMARHHHTGNHGELLAATYFQEKGYDLLYRNWRHKHLEVDLIAEKLGILHFIEVKTRTTLTFGYPEENADPKKIRHIVNAAEEFLYQYPQWQRIQFDVLSINISEGNRVEYFLIEDVYV